MPPPEPRSRTVSPGCSAVRAVGLPQPSDASTAPSGSPVVSPASYSCEVMGSPQQLLFRSEEHTSELQSRSDLVCRLLLEKKKTIPPINCVGRCTPAVSTSQ